MTNPMQCLCGLAVASLALTASPASAGELDPLGGAIRVAFAPADPALVGPPLVELATPVTVSGTTGTFRLTFNGQTTTASHFDGRFLTARDLTTDQGYRMEAGSTFAIAYTFDLYRGGVRVAAADADDGVAPFVLEGVDQGELVHRVDALPDADGGGHIELHTWSLGTWNATFDDGTTLVVDHVVVRAHELGHLLGLRHDVGPTVVRFASPTGYLVRLRSGRDGAKLGTWSAWSTSATLVSPTPTSDEAIDAFEVEIQRSNAPTIAMSGYIKVKKLNSGG